MKLILRSAAIVLLAVIMTALLAVSGIVYASSRLETGGSISAAGIDITRDGAYIWRVSAFGYALKLNLYPVKEALGLLRDIVALNKIYSPAP